MGWLFPSTTPNDEGYVAGVNGKFQDDNPYSDGAKKDEWDRGWQQGHEEYLNNLSNRRANVNDLGLRLFGLLSEGKQLSPTIAKTLRKSLGGQKDFQIEQTGDGGVQVTLNGQVVAGPFHSEDEVRQAMAELQSRGHTPVGKGWINWGLLGGGIAQGLDTPGGQIMAAAGAGGLFMETLLEVISFLRTGKYDFEEDKEEDY